jgi:hypothetical protein
MMHWILSAAAIGMAAIIMIRAVCVIYHPYYKTHSRGKLHFAGFGYSYVAYGAVAATALAYLITDYFTYGKAAAWLFLAAWSGMILFDRRIRN